MQSTRINIKELSLIHIFKFTRCVMDAIDPKYDSMTDFELVDELSKLGNVKVFSL